MAPDHNGIIGRDHNTPFHRFTILLIVFQPIPFSRYFIRAFITPKSIKRVKKMRRRLEKVFFTIVVVLSHNMFPWIVVVNISSTHILDPSVVFSINNPSRLIELLSWRTVCIITITMSAIDMSPVATTGAKMALRILEIVNFSSGHFAYSMPDALRIMRRGANATKNHITPILMILIIISMTKIITKRSTIAILIL